MGSLSLEEDDEVAAGSALSLDDEEDEAFDFDNPFSAVIKPDPDSPYNKMPASELQGMVMTWTVTNVTDFDAGTQANPGPAYREITVKVQRVKTLTLTADHIFEGIVNP